MIQYDSLTSYVRGHCIDMSWLGFRRTPGSPRHFINLVPNLEGFSHSCCTPASESHMNCEYERKMRWTMVQDWPPNWCVEAADMDRKTSYWVWHNGTMASAIETVVELKVRSTTARSNSVVNQDLPTCNPAMICHVRIMFIHFQSASLSASCQCLAWKFLRFRSGNGWAEHFGQMLRAVLCLRCLDNPGSTETDTATYGYPDKRAHLEGFHACMPTLSFGVVVEIISLSSTLGSALALETKTVHIVPFDYIWLLLLGRLHQVAGVPIGLGQHTSSCWFV